LGLTTTEESQKIEQMVLDHKEVRKEINAIEEALEKYAQQNSIIPHPAIKTLLMATIDYTERLESGEHQSFPPVLNKYSKIQDYHQWLSRNDMVAPSDFEEMFAKIIGSTPEVTSAIVWIRKMAPEEVHDNEYEKFLIVEGSCDIVVNGAVNQLIPGDYFAIPIHADHHVTVTSSIPCKVILQRVAA
jgi:mannose-6-phosphate isomerase-like protein (cupin superfamily)